MKIKFDDVSIDVPYEKFFDIFSGKVNPFETMFSKPNLDAFNDFLKKAPSSYANFFNEFSQQMEKYAHMKDPRKTKD